MPLARLRQLGRMIAVPIEAVPYTNVLPDAVSAVITIEARLRRQLERQSGRLLHGFNLPSGGDVRQVKADLAATQALLRDLAERAADAAAGRA